MPTVTTRGGLRVLYYCATVPRVEASTYVHATHRTRRESSIWCCDTHVLFIIHVSCCPRAIHVHVLCGACVMRCMCYAVHVLCGACVMRCMCYAVHVLCGACVMRCTCYAVHVFYRASTQLSSPCVNYVTFDSTRAAWLLLYSSSLLAPSPPNRTRPHVAPGARTGCFSPSLYSPTQYERPLALCTGPTSGAVTAHSYHTLEGPTHRHMCASTGCPAGTCTGYRRGK